MPVEARIFFALWLRHTSLLYINYMENATLLAEWLELSRFKDDPDKFGGYVVNRLAVATGLNEPQVSQYLSEAHMSRISHHFHGHTQQS